MTKRILIILLILSFALISTGEALASSSKAIALTLKVTGDVKLRKTGTDKVVPLKFGTPLDDGDWIRTGEDGFVSLIFADDKSQIKLRPSTEVVINGKRDAQSNIAKRITMEIGEIFVRVEKQRGTLEVATPTSVASVKGTEFWVVVEDGITIVYTTKGFIELLNRISGTVVEVGPGQQGISDPQGNNEVGEGTPGEDLQEPEDEGEIPRTMEIYLKDPDGRTRTMILQFLEKS